MNYSIGIRPGVCNALDGAISPDYAIHITGHDARSNSAFYNYVDAERSKCIPGARVLAGWPAPPWGQNGKAPLPPTLAALDGLRMHNCSPPPGAPAEDVDEARRYEAEQGVALPTAEERLDDFIGDVLQASRMYTDAVHCTMGPHTQTHIHTGGLR